jgi:hypothetical protein
MHFLQTSVPSSFLGPNILLSTMFSNILSLCSSLNVRGKFQTHTRPQVIYNVLHDSLYIFGKHTKTKDSELNDIECRVCSTHAREGDCIQGFGGKSGGKEINRKIKT